MSWTRTQEQRRGQQPYEKILNTEISYRHPSLDCRLKISIHQIDEETVPNLIVINYEEITPYVLYKKYQKTGLLYVSKTIDSSSHFLFHPKSPGEFKKIKEIIDIFIHHHHLGGSAMHADLYSVCALGNVIEAMDHNLLKLINAGKVNDAIHLAIAYQNKEYCFDPIWFLGEELYKRALLDDNIDLQCVYDLFDAISEKSPRFELAQKKLLDIIIPQANNDDPISLLEEKFIRALKAKEQYLADRFFDELCGNPLHAEPAVLNIHGDKSVLIKLAAQMRLLNTSNKNLQTKNSELTHKVEKQKIKIGMWKTANTNNSTSDAKSDNPNYSHRFKKM